MKKILKNSIYAIFTLLLFSCASEEALLDESVIDAGRSKREQTELDKWIMQTITIPYGIEVVYYWDKKNAEADSYTFPPKTENIKPVLETVKALWLDLYSDKSIGGAEFWKGKNPLKLYLYGGKNLDPDGQELIGNASSVGREIFIYNVNEFDPKNKEKVYVLMRSVHHQFAKLLTTIYPYNRYEFSLISNGDYRSTMSQFKSNGLPNDGVAIFALQYFPKKRDLASCPTGLPFQYFKSEKACVDAHKEVGISDDCYFCNYTQSRMNKDGFFTFHSKLSSENDFAEVVSVYLTNSQSTMDNAKKVARTPRYADTPEDKEIAKQQAERAYNNLVKKQQFVEEYFRKEVGISIKRLQLLSLQKMNAFLNND